MEEDGESKHDKEVEKVMAEKQIELEKSRQELQRQNEELKKEEEKLANLEAELIAWPAKWRDERI